jgi:hypothetical protein
MSANSAIALIYDGLHQRDYELFSQRKKLEQTLEIQHDLRMLTLTPAHLMKMMLELLLNGRLQAGLIPVQSIPIASTRTGTCRGRLL